MSSMRTHYCGLVTEELLGQTVSLCGWVHRRRDHGGVIFIDLRDREGLVQIVCHPDNAAVFKASESVRNEYCLRITGTVTNRLEGTVNSNLKSGKIEITATNVEVLNASVAVPFQLDDDNLSEDHPPDPPRTGPAPSADAKQSAPALQGHDGSAQVPATPTWASSTSKPRC